MILGKSNITGVEFDAQLNALRTPGTYAVSLLTSNKLGTGATFSIVIGTDGAIASITIFVLFFKIIVQVFNYLIDIFKGI
jgi:hypothetical protein